MISYGNFLFRHRNWLFPIVLSTLFFGFPPSYAGGSPQTDIWLDAIGIAIVLAGLSVRAAVVGLAYIKRGGLQKKVYAADLVTDGMFAHGRNPLYVGNLLMLLGYFVIHNNPWVHLMGGAFFLVAYHAIVAAEEKYLSEKFGEGYAEYCREVPRWKIRTDGIGKTFRNMEFNWLRVLIKDYSSMDTGIITIFALLACETVNFNGLEGTTGHLVTLGIALVLIQLVALTILILKKTGRLKA
jgi:protein-S-isoprenylcysteine O-methyltransferase Ste14